MNRSRFTDSQILAVLKEVESGVAVSEARRTHGIGNHAGRKVSHRDNRTLNPAATQDSGASDLFQIS